MASLKADVTLLSDQISPTGIPPHVDLFKMIEKNYTAIVQVPEAISERLQVVFEDHGIAGGNITRQFLETTLSNFVERLAPRANLPSDSPDSTHHSVLHSWGGRLFMLPKEFEFPSVDPASAWRLWWLGNDRKSQPPYRFISPLDLSSNKQRKILSSWKFMLGRFERVCLDAGLHMPQHPTEEDIAR
ncbi:hypothetical protein As57867_025436, partial [Aphanomyces stellatus]